MARVSDEPALPLEAVLESREHRVQRLPESRDLVVGRRHGKTLVERGRRNVGRASPHRLDRPEGRAGEQITAEGGEEEGDRPADQESRAEAAERLGSVLPGRTDHEHGLLPVPDGGQGQHPRRLVEAGDGRPVGEDRLALRRGELGGREQASPDRRRRVEHVALGVHDLGKGLPVLDQRALRRGHGTSARHERRQILPAGAEVLVESTAEVGAHPRVGEPPRSGEHDCHRQREIERQANASSEAAHDASSRRR